MALLPVHDQNPTHRRAWVTWTLLATNVVVFLLSPLATLPLGGGPSLAETCDTLAFLDRWAAVPAEVVTGEGPDVAVTGDPVPGGCVVGPVGWEKSVPLSVLTAMFLHGGWAHLAGNMLFLAVFGNNVEDRLGRLRFLLFYLACGYAATYGFALAFAESTENLVGASGAVAGVLGAYLVLFPRARVLTLVTFFFFLPLRLPAWVVLGSWFVLQYLFAAGAGLVADAQVAYLAHVVGFVAGAVLVLLLARRPPRQPAGPPVPQPYGGPGYGWGPPPPGRPPRGW